MRYPPGLLASGAAALAGALLAAALPSGPAAGEALRFRIDPAQSHLQLESGSQVAVPLGVAYGTVTLPLQAPVDGTGFTLPGGTMSDGRRTSLGGELRVDLSESLDAIRIIARRSSIEPGASGSWLPGLPTAPATPAPGALAVAYDSAVLGVGGRAVVRDAVLSLGSAGDVTLTEEAGQGPLPVYSFPAGCTGGDCPAFRLEDARLDADTTLGPFPRDGLRETAPLFSAPGTQGTLESLGGGRYRLTVPIDLATTLSAERIRSGIPLSIDLVATGRIVAVPEPGAAAGWAAALAALLWAARRRARAGAAVVAAALLSTGCQVPPVPDVGQTQLVGTPLCFDQVFRVTKDDGAELIGEFEDPNCGLFGFMGNVAGIGFTAYPYVSHSPADPGDFRNFLVGVSVTPEMQFTSAMEIRHSLSFTGSYAPRSSGSLDPRLWVKAKAFGLSSALGEPAGGSLALDLGVPTTVPVDGQVHYYDLDPAGGTLRFDAVADTERIAAGLGYQGLAVSYGLVWDVCVSHQQCGGMSPFCGPAGCTAGGAGAPCDHDAHCDGDLGYFCSSLGWCGKGAVGDDCAPDEGDCAPGNECSIALTCQVKF